MDEVDLERRIAAAVPRGSTRTAERDRLLRAVVEERFRSRRERRRPFVAMGVAGIFLAGGATAAVATSPYDFGFGVDPDRTVHRINPAGETCTTGYLVNPEGAGVTDDDPAVVAAREILADLDFANLSIDEDLLAANRELYAEHADDWAAKGHNRDMFDDPDADTITTTVALLIADGLRDRGLDPGKITLSVGGECTDPDAAP